MSDYKETWFVIPHYITELPGITLSFLKLYNAFFQFWNKGKPCFLNNESLMERMGVKAPSYLNKGFAFFEKHGELKRKYIDGQRYLIQPEKLIKIVPDKTEVRASKGISPEIGGYLSRDSAGISTEIHNINNINIKKLKRERTKSKSVRLPSDFVISEDNKALALKKGVDINWVFEKFKNNAKAKDLRRADWGAAFNVWMLTEDPEKFKTTETSPTPLTPQEKEIREEEYRSRVENHEPTVAERWAKENNLPWN